MSELLALGISHKTAPVALRERLALDRAARPSASLRELTAPRRGPRGRRDLDVQPHRGLPRRRATRCRPRPTCCRAWPTAPGIRPTELAHVVYTPRNCDAARQLYRVASGLESMIVGETEVQGQVRRALRARARRRHDRPDDQPPVPGGARRRQARAHARPAIGREPRQRLDRRGRARARGRGRPGRAQRRRDRRRRDERADRAGAGRPGRHDDLRRQPPRRPRPRAGRALRRRRSARSTRCPSACCEADIVVASTSSPHPIVGAEELELVMRARARRPLVLIDIAVPRDIEPACGDIEGVTLYDIDDLQAVVARNLEVRASERASAEAIVEEEIQRFARWMAAARRRCRRSPRCASTAPGSSTRCWRRTPAAGSRASPRDLARIEAVARAVMQRLLHEPTLRLRASTATRAATGACSSCASCSASRRARRATAAAERRAARRRPPAARRGREARDPRQRARARAGPRGRRRRSAAAELVDDHDLGRPRPRRAATRRAGSASSSAALLRGEVDLAVHSAKDVPGELRRRPRDRRASPPRADPRDALCGAAVARRAAAGRARRHQLAAPRGAAARAARATSRSSSCAATSTRGCASSPTASYDAIVLAARRAASASAAAEATGALLDELVPAAGPGRARARGARRRRDARAAARASPTATPRLLRRARARRARSRPTATRRSARTRADATAARCAARIRRRPRRLGVGARRAGTASDPEALGRARSRGALLRGGRGEVLGPVSGAPGTRRSSSAPAPATPAC